MSLTEQNKIGKTPAPTEGVEVDVTDVDAAEASTKAGKPPKTVTITVDEDPVTSPKETTPRAVLIAAGEDPANRQLVRVKGKHQEPFPDPDQPIKVHEGERFITTSTSGTPVS
jgi:hypothetical protein